MNQHFYLKSFFFRFYIENGTYLFIAFIIDLIEFFVWNFKNFFTLLTYKNEIMKTLFKIWNTTHCLYISLHAPIKLKLKPRVKTKVIKYTINIAIILNKQNIHINIYTSKIYKKNADKNVTIRRCNMMFFFVLLFSLFPTLGACNLRKACTHNFFFHVHEQIEMCNLIKSI